MKEGREILSENCVQSFINALRSTPLAPPRDRLDEGESCSDR